MRRWGIILLTGFSLVMGSQTRAFAAQDRGLVGMSTEKRVALVIGNSAYPSAPLDNPVNDARAMAAKLGKLGFDTILRVDATKAQMERAIGEFGEKLSENATGLVFYAGHGIQSQGRNFMIPVDAQITAEQRMRLEAVDTEIVLDQMAAARTRVSVVIMDACRNNPFERRFRSTTGAGLAQMSAPEGTLIAYATAPGKIANDGDGKNGLYTGELLKVLDEPGLKVEDVFKRVRIAVSKASNGSQTPWESSSLTGEFFFQLPKTSAGPAIAQSGVDSDVVFWQTIKDSKEAEDFADYLKRYPQGQFASIAERRVKALRSEAALSVPTRTASDITLDAIDAEYIAARKAVVRDAPDTKARQVVALTEGSQLHVTGKVRGGNWAAVEQKGKALGYVVLDALEIPAAYGARKQAEQQAKVAAKPVVQKAAITSVPAVVETVVGSVTEVFTKYGYLVFRQIGDATIGNVAFVKTSLGLQEVSIEKRHGGMISAIPKGRLSVISAGDGVVVR
jgi:hypothetical protein